MKWIIAIGASCVLNAFLVLWGRGSSSVTGVAMGLGLLVGLPLLILFAADRFAARRKSPGAMTRSGIGLVVALVIVSGMVSAPLGGRVRECDIRHAQGFVEALVPRLDSMKSSAGEYPEELSQVLVGQRPPRLFDSRGYHSDGTSFTFTIAVPGHVGRVFTYSSGATNWSCMRD